MQLQIENSSENRPTAHEIREEGSGSHHRGDYRSRSDGMIEQQIPPYHTIFKFFIPTFLVVITMKYQGKSEDPFETHPLQMWSFVAAIFNYSLMFLALKKLQNHQNKYLEMLSSVALASGVLSSLSLLSLLLSHFHGLALLYASWALSTVTAAWPLLSYTYKWLHREIQTLQLNTSCTYNWLPRGLETLLNTLISLPRKLFTRSNFSQQEPHRPPV